MDAPIMISIVQAVIACIALMGIYFAFRQADETKKTNQATILLKLNELWNDKEIYEAVNLIHSLRAEWKSKESNPNHWDLLAETWVNENKPTAEKSYSEGWIKRRKVAQLLNQMCHLVDCGYLLDKDLFNIIPETKRMLIVLMPIERAIYKEFATKEIPIDSWDVPMMKPFEKLELRFDKWYLKFKNQK